MKGPNYRLKLTAPSFTPLAVYNCPWQAGVPSTRSLAWALGAKERVVSDLKEPRVLFAAERTLLAWNRTSLSLIAFGFVVERAGLLIQALRPEAVHPQQLELTFWLGLALIMLGAVTSAYSARQYGIVLKSLTPAEFPPGYAARWGLAVNVVVAVLGAALAGVLIFWRIT